MPLRDPNSIIVRGALQNVSVQYRNSAYVADQVFPIIDEIGRKVKVAKYVKGPWFRDEAEPRAPGTAARVGHFHVTTQNLDPINYAYATEITDEEREEAAKPGNLPIQPDIDAAQFIADKLDMKREVRTAAIIHGTVWSSVSAGGTDAEGHWGDATSDNDTTLADIMLARDTILSNTGLLVNSMLMNWTCWSKLQTAPALLALMNPTTLNREALVTPAALAALIGIPNIILAAAVKISDSETVADTAFTSSNIWGSTAADKGMAFIYYRPVTPGLKVPSAGYQYRVQQDNGSGRLSTMWRDNARHAGMLDTQEEVDIAAVGLDCAYLYKDTATS
jgi:hypothetical protein